MIKIYIKKRLVIISVILVALLLVAAGLRIKRLNNSPLIPSYQFLADQELKMAFYDDNWTTYDNATRHIYSFPGDFNDICSIARAGLNSLGFTEHKWPGNQKHWSRRFHLATSSPKGSISVVIHERQKLSPRPTLYPELVLYKFRDGWILVEVNHANRKSRLQIYADKFLNRTH